MSTPDFTCDDIRYWTHPDGEGRRAWDRLEAENQALRRALTSGGGLTGDAAADLGLVDIVAEAHERGINVIDVMKERADHGEADLRPELLWPSADNESSRDGGSA